MIKKSQRFVFLRISENGDGRINEVDDPFDTTFADKIVPVQEKTNWIVENGSVPDKSGSNFDKQISGKLNFSLQFSHCI